MTSNKMDVEEWLDQMEPHFLTIKDVKNMQHNEENQFLCICRNFYDFMPEVTKKEALNPLELFKNNYKIYYKHDCNLKGKIITNKDTNEYNNFEFHIEYKKDYFYPLKDGKILIDEPQELFNKSSVEKDWTEYDDNTHVGWRGPMLKWKFVEECKTKLYNC